MNVNAADYRTVQWRCGYVQTKEAPGGHPRAVFIASNLKLDTSSKFNLGAATAKRKARNAEKEQKPARRLRDGSGRPAGDRGTLGSHVD